MKAGIEFESSNNIQEVSDGGYVVVGDTESYGAGDGDGWILKLTPYGDSEWQRTYGGSKDEYFASIGQTIDGGYIVGGNTLSYGAGRNDFWI